MKKLTREDGASPDLVADNIARLREIFPEIFADGRIDFDALKQALGESVDEREERYSFTWNGKSRAKQIAQTPSNGTLRPCPEESVNWETTKNIFIEGDNLEVLKLLQKSYHRKVKMIYIDPPYNTGKEFIYPDKWQDNLDTYLRYTGQVDDEGFKLSANAETSGRYHTNWLNMMYPRLKLARNLLRDDGVIFVSIDDNEQSNLKKLCDEVFGEENFLGCAARVSKKANNQGDYWSPNFDYLVTYAKSRESCPPFIGGINIEAYKCVDESGTRQGELYQEVRLYMTSLDPMRGCTNQRYFIECPDGSFVIPPGENFPDHVEDGAKIPPKSGKDKIWRWTKDRYQQNKNSIIVKRVKSSNLVDQDGNPARWNVFTKTYLNDVIEKASAKPNSLVENHINQSSSHELKKLAIPFPNAKPSSLIKFLCEITRVSDGDLVVDFFSGSGSTAHGVIDYCSSERKRVNFLLVQLPEPCDQTSDEFKDGYRTIAEIGKERIRRSAKSMAEKETDFDSDFGFKVFKLSSSNIKPWDAEFDSMEQDLLEAVDNIKPDRSEDDVLYELLLKYGLDLAIPTETRDIQGRKVTLIGAGALIVCLADNITLDVVSGIATLKDELQPEVMRVVFKDSGFADDVAKTNAAQILKQAGIDDVKSL